MENTIASLSPPVVSNLAQSTGPQCRIVVLAAGHQLLQEKYTDAIIALLQS